MHRVVGIVSLAGALLTSTGLDTTAWADPCGMVPPAYIEDTSAITRTGLQQTYVFHQNGVETFVIRPGFTGKVDEFGMLIPFPEPPALRKVGDEVFAHVAAAIDPPEIIINLFPDPAQQAQGNRNASGQKGGSSSSGGPMLYKDQVRVVKEEAVGMYEVAVLEAGGAAALKRWMDQHGYKYPQGMDAVCEEYVKLRWCFVAVKTRVGQKRGVDPKPGLRKVASKLPAGSAFDGHVQGMGFRFRTKELVVPMRLSAFNEGDLRNVVYLLTDSPRRIRSIPEEYVVRQISGEELLRNVTGPLPLRVIGGTADQIPAWQQKTLPQQRDPTPHNGLAKDLFAGDLLAAGSGRLSHPHEEQEKMLLRIGERLGLRGRNMDQLNGQALAQRREKVVAAAVKDLKKMTLTVIDGDFPREVLSRQNLIFAEFKMPSRRNSKRVYDCKQNGPPAERPWLNGRFSSHQPRRPSMDALRWGLAVGLALAMMGVLLCRRTQR